MKAPVLTPVLVPTPPTTGKGSERMRLQRSASRAAVHRSAGSRGAELDELEANELGAPLPSRGWHWSLTHDATWSAGVVDEAPIGIDLERIALRREEIVTQALSREEEALFREAVSFEAVSFEALSLEFRATAFTRAWTAKEAVLKAAGVGLLELSRCEVVEVTGDRVRIAHRDRHHVVGQWFHGDHVLALTLQHPEQVVQWTGLEPVGSGA